jgi:uncharacterized protein YbbC (DUF1343 family)
MAQISCLKTFGLSFSLFLLFSCAAQQPQAVGNSSGGTKIKPNSPVQNNMIKPAAERLDAYLPQLKGKTVAVFANQTSMVGNRHLVDVLKEAGVKINVIFGPEHGFRGTAEAGATVNSNIDKQTGIPVVSLYGKKRKPSKEDVAGVDVLLFDIQDVGVRFYTYISSLQDFMEAAIAYNLPLMVLDRPNPNGFYIDGPVLEPKYKSFVGMQPVPVVYGMTIGEYAQMLLGEGWLSKEAMEQYTQNVLAATYPPGAKYFGLTIIPCAGYTHNSKYVLPVAPSPNLPEIQSIYWYPATCFFEGTVLSEGRGTPKPFQIFGHPSLPKTMFAFVPEYRSYAPESKPYGKQCYGWNLHGTPEEVLQQVGGKIQIKYLLEAYRLFPEKSKFFILPKSGNDADAFFNSLAGNYTLMQQIKAGKTEAEIRKSWEPGLARFKEIRKKYLMYQ